MRIPVLAPSTEPDPQEVSELEDAVWFWTSMYEAGLPLPDLAIYETWEQKLAQEIFSRRGYDDAFERLHPRDRHGRFHSRWITGGLIGISPSRSASPVLADVVERFDSAEYQGFEQTVNRVMHRPEFDFESIRARRTVGFWEGEMEPSATIVFEGDVRHAERVAKELGGRYDQDAVALFAYDEEAPGARYLIHADDMAAAIERTDGMGFSGASFLDDAVVLYDMDGSDSERAFELARLLGGRVDIAKGWVRFLEKGTDYEELDFEHDGEDDGAVEGRGREGGADRNGHGPGEADGRDHALAGHPPEVVFAEWTPQQASLHPRDKKGRFRKKLGGALDFAAKLLDGKARAKELAKNATVNVGTENAALAVTGSDDWRETKKLRAAMEKKIEANARKVLAKDPVTQSLLTDPNVRQDYTSAIVWDTDVEGNPIRMAVDTHLQKPEGWEIAQDPHGTMVFDDPEAVYARDTYGPEETAPLGVSGKAVDLRVRSQFDPARTGPILEREMVGNEAADYLDMAAGSDHRYLPLSEPEFEALRRGETVPLRGTGGPVASWTEVTRRFEGMSPETRPRPNPNKSSGLEINGYVAAVKPFVHSRDEWVSEITAADVHAVVEARPVATNVTVSHPIDADVGPDAPFGTAKEAPSTNYTELWAYKPVAGLGEEFPNLATEQGDRGTQAIFATSMLNRERQARASAFAQDKGYTQHGAMKDEAMVRVAEGIDLSDPDVQAFKRIADVIIRPNDTGHGDTMQQRLASAIIQSWARSSSNEHTWGHYMQWAAAREFGVPLNEWIGGLRFKQEAPGMWATYQFLTNDGVVEQDVLDAMNSSAGFGFGDAFGYDIAQMGGQVASAEKGARKVLRAMYAATQNDLDSLGQPEFLLWRGMSRIEETKEIGLIKMYNPDVVSASPNPGGGFEVSMRRAATAEEAAMFASSFPAGATLPIPLDSKDRSKGFYWPPWDESQVTDSEVLAKMKVESLPIGEHGMIDRRVAIGKHHAREIAGVPPSMFEVSTSPVSRLNDAELPGSPVKANARLRAAPKGDVTDPKEFVIPYAEGRFIDQMRDFRSQANVDVPKAAALTVSRMVELEVTGAMAIIDPDDSPSLVAKSSRVKWEAVAQDAVKHLEEAGWDVAPHEETTPKIEAALSDDLVVSPWMLDHGMLEPIELKRTVTPGWLQGGVHVADDVRANPMSSHATSLSATSNFYGEGGGRIAAIVAKEDIIGMPGAGYGCLNEDEVVVLGTPRRYVVVPYGDEVPDERDVVGMIESGVVATPPPDVPLMVHELPTEIPTSFLEKPEADAFVWSRYSIEADGTLVTDLLPLAYWIDEQNKAAAVTHDGLDLTVFPGNIVRNDATGETVHFDPGAEEITAIELQETLKRAWEQADAAGYASGWDAVTVRGEDGPAPGTTGFEPDADLAWENVIDATMNATGFLNKSNAYTLAAVIRNALETDSGAEFEVLPSGAIKEVNSGITYEFEGFDMNDQAMLDEVAAAVAGFFAPDPFSDEPVVQLDPTTAAEVTQFVMDVSAVASNADNPLIPLPLSSFVTIMKGLLGSLGSQNGDIFAFTLFSEGPPAIVVRESSGQKYEFPGVTIPGGTLGLREALKAIGTTMGFEYAEADPVPATYIFIDDPDQADWPKATWDLWGVDSAAELDAYLAREHETPEHFMTLPAFYLNLDEKPAWLKLWAMQHTGRAFADWAPSAHPRWPSGDKRGGEFRPKLGGIVRAVDPELLKDIDDILDEFGLPPAPDDEDVEEHDVGDFVVGDLVVVANPGNWTHKDQYDEEKAKGKVYKVIAIDPTDEWPLEVVEVGKDPDAPFLSSTVQRYKVGHVEKFDMTPDTGPIAEARKLLAKPKLKLPGVAARSREIEVWKQVASKRRPFYMTAAQSAGAELMALQDRLRPGEYLYVRGTIRQPLEGRNANSMGYVYSRELGGWTFADNVRWRRKEAETSIGGMLPQNQELSGEYVLWGQTGATLADRPVDKTGSFGRNEQPSKIAELLLGAWMSDRDSLKILSPEDAGKTKSKETAAREREMLDGIRTAAGDWLGYGIAVTDDDVKKYLDGFQAGTTMGRDPHWPDSDDMWVKGGKEWIEGNEEATGWDVFARRTDEWGWEEEPSRHLTDDEALREAGEVIRQRLIEQRQHDQTQEFREEIQAENAAQGTPEPEQLPNGAPGPLYVEQHKEILRVGKLLDDEVQKRYAAKTKDMPDMKYLTFKKENADFELKQAAKATHDRNGPLVFDLMADEMMFQTGSSRQDAEAAIGYGYWKHHNPLFMSHLIGDEFYGHDVTFAQWKAAWNDDLRGKSIFSLDEKGYPMGTQVSTLMNDGDQVSDYAVGNIFRVALKAHAGNYDLTKEEMAKIPWYGQDNATNEMLDRFSPKADEAVLYDLIDNARVKYHAARKAYDDAEDTAPMALRDSALEVLREVRDIGGGPKIEYASQVKKDARALTDEAYDYYPRDWQERLSLGATGGRASLPLYVALTRVRGKFHSRNATDKKTGGLADQIWGSASRKGLRDQGGKHGYRFPVLVHELGHRFENYMPEIGAAEWTYWHTLARGRSTNMEKEAEKIRSLNKIRRERGVTGDAIYKSKEVGIADEMKDEYAVKTYSGGHPDRDWELLTMGVEDLMTGGRQYIGEDKEYRRWILGLLATI